MSMSFRSAMEICHLSYTYIVQLQPVFSEQSYVPVISELMWLKETGLLQLFHTTEAELQVCLSS